VIDNAIICGAEHVKGVVDVTPPEFTKIWEMPAPTQVKRP
jgi:hypothetical protein